MRFINPQIKDMKCLVCFQIFQRHLTKSGTKVSFINQSKTGSVNLLKNLTDLLKSRKRVALNGQDSSWSDALASVPQRSILGPLLFIFLSMIYLMVFSVTQTMHNINNATNDLNNDLTKITKWAFEWKMSFNPDISKQAHEVCFPAKGL